MIADVKETLDCREILFGWTKTSKKRRADA
jgi:hypothetical protein